jgi:hypothetical protein
MKVFIGVTCYDHKIFGECSEAILKNCLTLMENGHQVLPYYSNDLYIDRSRNMIAHLFLDSDCTDLVFVDSDLKFDDDAILKLLKYDKDIVAGLYPYKKNDLEFPITLRFDEQNNCKEEETGLVRAWRVPTGLMRIQRRVLEGMPSIRDERKIDQFFETGIRFKDDINWYGEDTYFCRRCKELGFDIFVEPTINFTHYGIQGFSGNLHEYLMGRQVDTFLNKLDEVKDGIRGWTTDKELKILSELAAMSESVVEIGCWKGRSTKVLLDNCKGKVYAIDIWEGSPTDYSGGIAFLQDIYSEFLKNVGHYTHLFIDKRKSLDAVKDYDKIDMVFIDADHTYNAVKSDIEAWLPKCKKFICGHDYDYPDVKKAVNEIFNTVNIIDSLWWVEI